MSESTETTSVSIPKSLVPALHTLLRQKAAALEEDAQRIGEATKRAPPPRRAFPLTKRLVEDGVRFGVGRDQLRTVLTEFEGDVESARAWTWFASRRAEGFRLPSLSDDRTRDDYDRFAPEILREIVQFDRTAGARAKAEARKGTIKGLPTAQLKATSAQLEEQIEGLESELNSLNNQAGTVQSQLTAARRELADVRAAVDRRDPAKLVLDSSLIREVAEIGEWSLGVAEKVLRAFGGDREKARGWAYVNRSTPFPVDRNFEPVDVD